MTRASIANAFRLFSLVVLLAAALPALVLAGAVTQLTTNTAEDLNTDAAVDVAGNIHVVYERGGSIYYRSRTGTTWSAEELVAAGTNPAVGAGATSVPEVAFLSGGNVLFTARVGGTWTPPLAITPGSYVDMAVDASGVAHVVYINDTYGDGYRDVNYTNNGGPSFPSFPAGPIQVWNSWYYYDGWGRSANYFFDYAPAIAVDPAGNYAIAYSFRWISGGGGWNDWGTSLHVYQSAGDTDAGNADLYKGYYPGFQRNGLAVGAPGDALLAFGSTLARISGTSWSESSLPAGSSHTLDTTSDPALHVAYVNGTGGIEYAVDDTGAGFGTPLVLSTTTTGRSPIVVAETDPFVAFEGVDSGDYEVWFARTTNQAPVLDPVGDKSVSEGTTLSFAVSGSDPDGDGVTFSASNLPVGASFDPGTATFSWTPDYTQAGAYDTVTFQASDGTDTDSETITITVNQANAPPVLGAVGDKSVDEMASLSFTLSATDIDGDGLTYGATNLPTGASLDPATGAFSWTPTYDQAGTYPGIVFTVTDDGIPNLADSETITITVNDVNRPPVLGAVGDKTVDEMATLSFTLVGSDGDPGNSLTYSADNLPTGASVDPATGQFSWTPTYEQAGSYHDVEFTVTDDGSPSKSASETISIIVNQVNAPPVLGAVGNKSVDENASLSFTLSATDVDGDTLTYSATNLPTGATLDPDTGAFSWTPDYDQAGSFLGIVFTVTDDETPGKSDSETITITVNDVNRAPVLGAIGDKTVDEGAELSFIVAATDGDGDALTYSATNLPAGATLNPTTGAFSWTPTYEQAGSYPGVVFTATDDGTPILDDSETITITVNPVNAPPVLAPIGDRSVSEGATLTFFVSATDVDGGDTLTYGASGLPTGAAFDPGTRIFSWTPAYDQAGVYPNIVFTVTDNGDPVRSDSETITITVEDVNRPPVLQPIGDKTVMEGHVLSFTVSATDEDNDTLTYGVSNLPTGATFDPATGAFSWRPGYDQAGDYAGVVFTAADAATTSEPESITITVTDNPTPPGFFTVVPCRVIDTRSAAGDFGGPALVAGADRTFDVVAGACGIPASARAISVNVTVTQPTAAGNLRLYPAGVPLPTVSTINYSAGQTRGNNAIVRLSELGELTVRCAQASGTAHLILDVNGYFQEEGAEQ